MVLPSILSPYLVEIVPILEGFLDPCPYGH